MEVLQMCICFVSMCEFLFNMHNVSWHFPGHEKGFGDGLPKHRIEKIFGVSLTCSPMKVLFQQLVLIRLFVCRTNREEEAMRAHIATIRAASGV